MTLGFSRDLTMFSVISYFVKKGFNFLLFKYPHSPELTCVLLLEFNVSVSQNMAEPPSENESELVAFSCVLYTDCRWTVSVVLIDTAEQDVLHFRKE